MNPDDLRAIAEKAATPNFDGKFVIWSNEHRAWWRATSNGYCVDFMGAGLYDESEAQKICASHDPSRRDEEYLPATEAFAKWAAPSQRDNVLSALLDELDGLKARVESAEKVLRQADAAISRAHAETRSMEDADLFEQVRIAASAHFTKHPEGKI